MALLSSYRMTSSLQGLRTVPCACILWRRINMRRCLYDPRCPSEMLPCLLMAHGRLLPASQWLANLYDFEQADIVQRAYGEAS